MKINTKFAGLLLAVFLVAGPLTGCGAGKQPVEVASKQDVSAMENLRKSYDSVGGDYSKLSDDQKKQFLDFTKGNQAAVDSMWATMGRGVGAGPGPGAGTPNSAEEARKRQTGGSGK